jgi:hypothetical protein
LTVALVLHRARQARAFYAGGDERLADLDCDNGGFVPRSHVRQYVVDAKLCFRPQLFFHIGSSGYLEFFFSTSIKLPTKKLPSHFFQLRVAYNAPSLLSVDASVRDRTLPLSPVASEARHSSCVLAAARSRSEKAHLKANRKKARCRHLTRAREVRTALFAEARRENDGGSNDEDDSEDARLAT